MRAYSVTMTSSVVEVGRRHRLSRNDWLALAMDVLSKGVDAELRIYKLCQRLGVTKGSSYAHFRNRADFVSKFVAYWVENFTQSVIVAIDKLRDKPAEERLLALMHLVENSEMAKYDTPLRAWSSHDAIVAQAVKMVDQRRFEYVRQIFHDMGFRGADLEIRTRLFVVYQSASSSVHLPESHLNSDESTRLRHAFLTRA